VTSNTTWTVTPSVAWVMVSKTSGGKEGVIDVTVAANPPAPTAQLQ